jgi:SMI1 / KNR4 family (SUKH-1)
MTLTERVQKKKDEFGWSWIRGEHRMEPTPTLFREVENILTCHLDEDYREFVLAVGGGSFDGYVQVAGLEPNPWGWLMAETFFGFYDDNSYDVRKMARGYKYQLPPFFVPLVIDPFANVAVYAAAGEHKGKVYFQDKEHREFAAEHKITDVYDELEARGMETRRMDIAQAIIAWETLHARVLPKPPRFGNLYLIATSLEDFVDRVRRYEHEANVQTDAT